MKTKLTLILIQRAALWLLLSTLNYQLPIWAQGTAFTYQGRLTDAALPASGSYDLRFVLYTAEVGGSQVGPILTNSATAISGGLFTVALDFGDNAFTNASRFLEIAVRTNGGGIFTTLSQRQKFTPTPYAITAGNLTGTVGNAQLANNSITVNAGAGLSGGGAVALGSSTTLDNAGVISVTGNSDITVLTAGGSVTLGTTATSENITNRLVKRDASGGFSAASLTLDNNLYLPPTTDSQGIIYSGGKLLMHQYGIDSDSDNFFAGPDAGNLTMSGDDNTGVGYNALRNNSGGSGNVAHGVGALASNTFGRQNTATGLHALGANTLGNDNTASGAYALTENTVGNGNTAHGARALSRNFNGTNNTATGRDALRDNKLGSDNTASGTHALTENTVGNRNTAHGAHALLLNTNGANNTASGYATLENNKSGSNNTAIGTDAMKNNTTGGANTAMGVSALLANTTGFYSTANGQSALRNATTGGSNTSMGAFSLLNLTGGSGNIAIGVNAGTAISTGNDNIDIGNTGFGNESATIRIGTLGTHTKAVMNGIFGVAVGGGSAVMVNANGLLGTVVSSRRFKQNIESMDDASEVLLALHPVTFQYKTEMDPDCTPQFGLIAEEVAKVAPSLVVRDAKQQIYSVRYEAVNAMLLNEFLKQHRRAEDQSTEIAALKERAGKVDALEKRLSELEQVMQSLKATK